MPGAQPVVVILPGAFLEKEEWVAYSWGKYVLKKLLANPDLTAAQKAVLQQRLQGVCGYATTYCNSAGGINVEDIFRFLNDWFAKEGQERRELATNPVNWYQATYPYSGVFEVVNGTRLSMP